MNVAVPNMLFFRAFGVRAYQTKNLLENFFLQGGAGIHGTIAWNLCNPFTFDQKLKDGDKRTNMPTTGGRMLFIKEAVVHGIPLYAFAFRNVYKSVILTISSMFSGYEHQRSRLFNFFIFLISGVYFSVLISNCTFILIWEWILEV